MTDKSGGRHLTGLFVLLLCCIFAGTVFAVLLLGVDVYKNVAQRGMDGYGERTSLAYISAKVRHYDRDGSVSVVDFDGISALKLSESFGGDTVYSTYIYYWDGQLYELLMQEDLELPPDAGSPIGIAESVSFAYNADGLIEVVCESVNGAVRLLLSPRSGKAVSQ